MPGILVQSPRIRAGIDGLLQAIFYQHEGEDEARWNRFGSSNSHLGDSKREDPILFGETHYNHSLHRIPRRALGPMGTVLCGRPEAKPLQPSHTTHMGSVAGSPAGVISLLRRWSRSRCSRAAGNTLRRDPQFQPFVSNVSRVVSRDAQLRNRRIAFSLFFCFASRAIGPDCVICVKQSQTHSQLHRHEYPDAAAKQVAVIDHEQGVSLSASAMRH
jgi:hypothetical protein